MQSPKRTKYRKYQKGKSGGISDNSTEMHFGKFAIKSVEAGRLPMQTIEAVRRVLSRKLKRSGFSPKGKIVLRVFADIPITKKPTEVRMGKGKGNVVSWICRIKAGQILFEIDGVSLALAKQAAHLAYYKFPLKTKFIQRDKNK